MNIKIIVCSALVYVWFSISSMSAQQPLIVADYIPYTYAVCGDNGVLGSSVLFRKGKFIHFATANHVIEDLQIISGGARFVYFRAYSEDGETITREAKIKLDDLLILCRKDTSHDVALICHGELEKDADQLTDLEKIKYPDLNITYFPSYLIFDTNTKPISPPLLALPKDGKDMRLGGKVYSIGYPTEVPLASLNTNSLNPVVTSGVLSALNKHGMIVQIPLYGGNSGGPILYDYRSTTPDRMYGGTSLILAGVVTSFKPYKSFERNGERVKVTASPTDTFQIINSGYANIAPASAFEKPHEELMHFRHTAPGVLFFSTGKKMPPAEKK